VQAVVKVAQRLEELAKQLRGGAPHRPELPSGPAFGVKLTIHEPDKAEMGAPRPSWMALKWLCSSAARSAVTTTPTAPFCQTRAGWSVPQSFWGESELSARFASATRLVAAAVGKTRACSASRAWPSCSGGV
jgi:hypothetical protein